MILQSDNGDEFVAAVIVELKLLWSELVLVNGRPRHSQSQGSIERSNQDVSNMVLNWCHDNNSAKWSLKYDNNSAIGLKFVKFHKNNSFHSGIDTKFFANFKKFSIIVVALFI